MCDNQVPHSLVLGIHKMVNHLENNWFHIKISKQERSYAIQWSLAILTLLLPEGLSIARTISCCKRGTYFYTGSVTCSSVINTLSERHVQSFSQPAVLMQAFLEFGTPFPTFSTPLYNVCPLIQAWRKPLGMAVLRLLRILCGDSMFQINYKYYITTYFSDWSKCSPNSIHRRQKRSKYMGHLPLSSILQQNGKRNASDFQEALRFPTDMEGRDRKGRQKKISPP